MTPDSIKRQTPDDFVIALMGNPNTGKSTVFNALTGMNQHTGNWAGKTVGSAIGHFRHQERPFTLVDLPGTYSLLSQSADEQVARDFLCLAGPDATVVVTDATLLERNLNLVLQVLELTPRVAVAVNLIDEARRKGITVDTGRLADQLGVPVLPMAARSGEGLPELKDVMLRLASGDLHPAPKLPQYDAEVEREIERLLPRLESLKPTLPPHLPLRWLALRVIEGDASILTALEQYGQQDQTSKRTLTDGHTAAKG